VGRNEDRNFGPHQRQLAPPAGDNLGLDAPHFGDMVFLGPHLGRGQRRRFHRLGQLGFVGRQCQRARGRAATGRGILLLFVLAADQFQQGRPLERVDPRLAQQAHGVKIGCGGQVVLLRQPPCHPQLPPRQPLLPNGVNIGRGHHPIPWQRRGQRRPDPRRIRATPGHRLQKALPAKAVIIL